MRAERHQRMNWIAFFILAYVTLGFQTGLSAFVRVGSVAEPNLGLLALVFVCINAQRQDALLGAFVLGAMQDLATQAPFGLFAFSYGLAALAVTSAAHAVYRDHPVTHFCCTLLAGGITALVVMLHGRIHGGSPGAWSLFTGALYSAILAPFVIGMLQRMKRVFAFKHAR
jgi:rod shape-determining protein MreD